MLHWVALGLGLAPSCAALNLPGALLFPSWRPHALALPMQLGITLSNVFFFGVCLKQHVPAWCQRVRYALQVEVSLPRETLTLYRPQISVMSPTTAPKPLTALNESH